MAPVGGPSRKRPIFTGAPTPTSSRPRVGGGPMMPPGPPPPPPPMMGGFPPMMPPVPAGFFPPVPPPGGRLPGHVLSYDHGKGYGFIRSEAIPEDIYFQKKELPAQLRDKSDLSLKGDPVDFEVVFTNDGKPRAVHVRTFGGGPRVTGGGGGGERRRDRDVDGPPPPLDIDTIDAMTRFLEERGGGMDFGKFSREFKAVKKSQLEQHFTLVAEDGDKGGRWTITLPGVDPPLPEERVAPPEPKESVPGTPLGRLVGKICAWDQGKGFGFIKSDEVQEGDIYFKKSELPFDARNLGRSAMVGRTVEFDGLLTHDGKPRAESIALLDREHAGAGEKKSDEPVPELTPERIQAMVEFLEEQGGHMDYGRFANQFPGVKKAQITQCDHFALVQESDRPGGRWQITLPGIEPMFTEETPDDVQRSKQPPPPPVAVAPCEGLWLIGCVKKWDPKKQFGFMIADGADDVFIHRNDLPQEIQGIRNLMGVEMAFELMLGDDGKRKVKTVRPLIQPNGRGGWQLRRA